MKKNSTPTYKHGDEQRTGILLTNLGTPDEPTAKAVRRYLAEFLWDNRVVEIPRPIWWMILHGAILPFRSSQSAAKYAEVWTEEGSPLLVIARKQADAVREQLTQTMPHPPLVALGMRYGQPSIESAFDELTQQGATRILLLPLYPQYSATTTASTFDALASVFKQRRWIPELRVVNSYHESPAYIDALANSVREAWNEKSRSEKLLMSFHGLPDRNLHLGDPYHCQCHKTARLLAEKLELCAEEWAISFQSRFGKAKWLQPYTSETLKQWASAGVSSVDVICPGFSADCLETLEEIEGENREYFEEAGGKSYRYIPALNDRADHIAAIADVIQKNCAGWPEFKAGVDWEKHEGELEQSRERAVAMDAKV